MAAPTRPHTWKFFRAGGFDQVLLESGADLMALDQLDQKLWVALSCPTRGLEFDTRTLDLIDTDRDGRIKVPEIIAAVKWAGALLKNPDELIKGSSSLPLAAIDDSTDAGRQLLASAKQILISLGKPEVASISIDDTIDTERIFAQTNFNGDGIVPADAAENPAVRSVIEDIIACLGAETDRSGKPGISQAKADQFFAEAQAYVDWCAKAGADAAVTPLGEATAAAEAALVAVRAKVDDYFARCRLAAFDARAMAALNRQETEYLEIAAKDMTIQAHEIAGFPLARVDAGRPLPLKQGLNPAWVVSMARFVDAVIVPLLGEREELTEQEWAGVTAKLAPFEAWLASKAGQSVEKIGRARLVEIVAQGKTQVDALIARDKALEREAADIATVDKLVRYNRDLRRLLNNFVNFRDFYSRKDKAVFQAGTLYIDQRSCDLCVRVEDAGRHATMAHLSRTCLAYCDMVRKASGEKMTIAAALTAGDADNLMVGRNGLFYDRQGRDWDATITKIIDHPISIRQAFLSPYKRVLRWIEEQVAKRAAAADAASMDKLTTTATGVGTAAQTGKPAGPPPKLDIGIVAALGVAVGGITAALGVMMQAFFGLGMWMPLGIVALILLISGPAMIIAWLKLRQRNMGPILDANGWAVNARAKINIPFGGSLTSCAKLPAGSKRSLADPYADTHLGAPHAFAAVLVLAVGAWAAWNFGAVEKIRPGLLPTSAWQKKHAEQKAKPPATQPAAAAKQ